MEGGKRYEVWLGLNRSCRRSCCRHYRNIVESLGYAKPFNLLEGLREEVDALFGSTKSLEMPHRVKPETLFDVLFTYTYNPPCRDDETRGTVSHELHALLKMIHTEASRIRTGRSDLIESLHQYMMGRGVEFQSNSEGPEIVLSFCAALKELFGLYNYQLWPHFQRNLEKGIL